MLSALNLLRPNHVCPPSWGLPHFAKVDREPLRSRDNGRLLGKMQGAFRFLWHLLGFPPQALEVGGICRRSEGPS